MRNTVVVMRKVLVGLGGGLIIIVGAVLIPTPAPEGWLIVFAGITLLSTEFSFARRLLEKARQLRQRMNRWLKTFPRPLQVSLNVLVIVILVAIVLAGVWFTVQAIL